MLSINITISKKILKPEDLKYNMAYCYVEDIDTSLIVVHMLQTSSKYFPIPTVIDGEDLKQKLKTLNKLYRIWIEDKLNDSSYQSEVYKRICGEYL